MQRFDHPHRATAWLGSFSDRSPIYSSIVSNRWGLPKPDHQPADGVGRVVKVYHPIHAYRILPMTTSGMGRVVLEGMCLAKRKLRAYRPGVGIMLLNPEGFVFVGHRIRMPPGLSAW